MFRIVFGVNIIRYRILWGFLMLNIMNNILIVSRVLLIFIWIFYILIYYRGCLGQ